MAVAKRNVLDWPVFDAAALSSDLAALQLSKSCRAADAKVAELRATLEGATRDPKALLSTVQCRSLRFAEDLALLPSQHPQVRDTILAVKSRLAGGVQAESAADLGAVATGEALTPALLSRSGIISALSAHSFAEAVLRHPSLYSMRAAAGAPPQQSRSTSHAAAAAKDAREIQTVRDIERDSFAIDGAVLAGAAGFATVLDHLVARLRAAAAAARWWGAAAAAPDAALAAFAKLVLRAANRTESGGVSFEAITALVAAAASAAADDIIVVPASAAAEPLRIETGAGPFLERVPEALGGGGVRHALGLRVHIEALTAYAIYSQASMDAGPLLRVRARYRNRIYCALSPPRATRLAAFEDVDYSSNAGLVELAFEAAEGLSAAAAAASAAVLVPPSSDWEVVVAAAAEAEAAPPRAALRAR